MFVITCNGIQLFASESILECFEYMKKAPELMPKSYKSLQLKLPDWFNRPMLEKPGVVAPISDGINNIHIHIHLND